MQKAVIKKLVSVVAALSIATAIFAGCTGNNANNGTEPTTTAEETTSGGAKDKTAEETTATAKGEFNLWSFSEEPKAMIEAFNKKFPDIKVNFTQVPNDQYAAKLTTVLQSGAGVPDVFNTEVKYLKRFADKGYMEDLSKPPYNASEAAAGMTKYVADLCKNSKGEIIALSWQATPGSIFYRKDVASKYFGTDDPVQVFDKVFKDYDSVYKAAKTIKDGSGGKQFLFADATCMSHFYLANIPWVKDGKLVVDNRLNAYIDAVKKFRDEGLDGRMGEWSPGWSGAMATDKVMAYPGTTWYGFYVLKGNAKPESKGKFAMTEAPNPYWWGGTFSHIYSKSEKKDLAWEYIKYTCTDQEYLISRAKNLGDFPSVKAIQDKLAADTTFGDEYLGNQNTFVTYTKSVEKIDGSIVSGFDDDMAARFTEALNSYVNGKLKREEVLPKFKKDVKTQFANDIKVED